MQDESSGSPEQDHQPASPESDLPDVPQASPINGNGHSPADSLQPEQARSQAASDTDVSVSSPGEPGVNNTDAAKTETDHQQLSTRSGNGNGALEPRVQPPAPDSSEAPGPEIQESALGGQESPEGDALSEDSEEEYVPRDRWIPEETLRDTTPMVDLIRVHYTGWSSVSLCLIEWNGHEPKITVPSSAIRVDGVTRSTPIFPEGLRKSLLLPTALDRYGSTSDLFRSIQSRIRGWVRLSEMQAALLTYWCLATWFPEYLSFVPRLTITGPRLAADSLMQALHSVCCKPIPLASISPAVLRTIPFSEFIPTLLIRSSRLNKTALEFLDASDAHGYFVANGKDLHRSQTIKCLYLGEDFKPTAFTSEGIHIHLGQNAFLPTPRIPSKHDVQTLQNQLFLYRVYNRSLVQHSSFRVHTLIPELCALAQQLGAVVVEDWSLQHRVIDLFESQNEQSFTDRAFALHGIVLRAVLHHCHQADQQKVLVREITDTVNTMYKNLGESTKFSNEAVGHALKSIGLYTRRLGSSGRGLILDKLTKREAHQLSRMNEVIPADTETNSCSYCQPQGSAADELM
jgi:hypothetical protein